MKAPATRAIYLLGTVELVAPDRAAAERILAHPKMVALLAYLALPSVGRFLRRDAVVGLLWPELGQERARAALRKTVHAIRTALGPDVVVGRGDEDIALAAEAIWCDAAAFTLAAETGSLVQAIELYRGELLPGFHLAGCGAFDLWLDVERTAARERAAAAAWALAQLHEEEDELTDAARWARKTVRFSWNDERALRRALLMLDRVGDRTGALHLYEEFSRRLRDELEVEPSAETVALVNSLRK